MIQEAIAKLRVNVPALKLIGAVAEFQLAAERMPAALPACYLLNLDEQPEPNKLGNIILQHVHASIGVVLVVRNVGDASGAAACVDTEVLRKQVKDQLYGWSPASGHAPFERGRSGILAFREGCIWWQDIYTTSYYDRSMQ